MNRKRTRRMCVINHLYTSACVQSTISFLFKNRYQFLWRAYFVLTQTFRTPLMQTEHSDTYASYHEAHSSRDGSLGESRGRATSTHSISSILYICNQITTNLSSPTTNSMNSLSNMSNMSNMSRHLHLAATRSTMTAPTPPTSTYAQADAEPKPNPHAHADAQPNPLAHAHLNPFIENKLQPFALIDYLNSDRSR